MSMTAVQSPFENAASQRPAGIAYLTRNMIRVALIGGALFTAMATGLLSKSEGLDPLVVKRLGLTGLLACAIPAAVLAYGLMRERRWTRPLLLVSHTGWALSPVATLPIVVNVQAPAMAVVGGVAAGAGVWWYLYRKPNVVAYYAFLPRGG